MKDLSNIPEEFHILFTSDWNKGTESKMTSLQRAEIGELYLKYNKYVIQQSLRPIPKENQNDEVITGFVKD